MGKAEGVSIPIIAGVFFGLMFLKERTSI